MIFKGIAIFLHDWPLTLDSYANWWNSIQVRAFSKWTLVLYIGPRSMTIIWLKKYVSRAIENPPHHTMTKHNSVNNIMDTRSQHADHPLTSLPYDESLWTANWWLKSYLHGHLVLMTVSGYFGHLSQWNFDHIIFSPDHSLLILHP